MENVNKQKLIEVSQSLRLAETMGLLDDKYIFAETMNEKLLIHYGIEKLQINTYKGWLENGFQVKKGERSFHIWSKPIRAKKKNESTETEEKDEKSFKFWNIAYVFTSEQVELINVPKLEVVK